MKHFLLYVLILTLSSTISQAQSSLLSKPEEDKIFNVVEDMPIPWFYKSECVDVSNQDKQHCYAEKLSAYLMSKTVYPEAAVANKTQGIVIVEFIISKDGSIKEADIVKDIGSGCGDAALAAVVSMPDWIPGKQRGKAVNVRYTLPIRFQLR